MGPDCLPNIFIVGAAKCGTTSLHHYLDQHPDISMSQMKEPCVFSKPHWGSRHASYEGLLDCAAPYRGEASTSYSRYPADGDAAARIHAAVPDAKLIYLVRDPVERAVSDYVHHVARGYEKRSIDDAFRDFSNPENYYVAPSRYAFQVRHYLEHFPASSLLVLDQSDLRHRRDETMCAVFGFIGVDADFRSPEFEVELLKRDDYFERGTIAWRLRESRLANGFRKLPLRQRLRIARIARRVLPTEQRPTLDPALEAELRDFLMPEVEQLRQISGNPLEGLPGTVASPGG
jgi:hypothetical protein